jgi:hypothetical protein
VGREHLDNGQGAMDAMVEPPNVSRRRRRRAWRSSASSEGRAGASPPRSSEFMSGRRITQAGRHRLAYGVASVTRATHSALAHTLNVVYPNGRVATGHLRTDHH